MNPEKTRLPHLAVGLMLSLAFALGMASLLNYYKFGNTLSELVRNNVSIAAQGIQESFRLSLSMGIGISSMEGMPALLERQARIDSSIVAIRISDMKGEVLYTSTAVQPGEHIPEDWLNAAKVAKNSQWRSSRNSTLDTVGWVLKNNFDIPVALLSIDYSAEEIEAGKHVLFPSLVKVTLSTLGVSFVLGLFMLLALGHLTQNTDRLALRATVLIMGITFFGLIAVSWQAVALFEQNLWPKLEQNARQTGQVESSLMLRAMSYGIALEELFGVEDVLKKDLSENKGLASFSVQDNAGRKLFHASKEGAEQDADTVQVVAIGTVGNILVGLDSAFAQKLVREMTFDILVVLVVALCFTLEAIAFLPGSTDREKDPLQHSRGIRAPAFIFFLSEELTRSFLPNFVASLAQNVDFLPQHIVIGSPIILFMLVVALSQPWLGGISQRFGNRRLLMAGTGAAVTGFLLCATAGNLYMFIVARVICGLGYAAFFVGAQGHILENTNDSSRSAGFALFVGAIMVATICGTSVGGILADNIGGRATFFVAAAAAGVALPLIRRLRVLWVPTGMKSQKTSVAVRIKDAVKLVENRQFLTLCVSAAIPAKMLLTGCCFFLLPLYIISIGSSQAMAGRLLMVYATCMVVLMPMAARYASQYNTRTHFILAGLLISAFGGLLATGVDNFWLATGLVISLGIGQAMSITAQSTLVSSVAGTEIESLGDGYVYGVYRLMERLGNAMGPLFAGALLTLFGFRMTFVCMGVLALISALVFYLRFIRTTTVVNATSVSA